MAKKKPQTVSDALRTFIAAADETPYAISKRAGVEQSVVSRFLAGSQLRTDAVDKLCEALGLELRLKGK